MLNVILKDKNNVEIFNNPNIVFAEFQKVKTKPPLSPFTITPAVIVDNSDVTVTLPFDESKMTTLDVVTFQGVVNLLGILSAGAGSTGVVSTQMTAAITPAINAAAATQKVTDDAQDKLIQS